MVLTQNNEPINTIIIGKGAAGKLLYKELRKKSNINIIGYVDDFKKGVLGNTKELISIIDTYKIALVYIAMPSVDKTIIKGITYQLNSKQVKVKILPSYADIIQYGSVSEAQTKPVSIEDILGRPPVKQDFKFIKNNIKGKTILITGAAGSIGSELAYQVALCEPSKLLCIDTAETPIFNLQNKLSKFGNIYYYICDINNASKLEAIISQNKINLLLHAAAYKHVPLMEHNPDIAVQNNIFGTDTLLSIACSYAISNILIVSTDKAVNPTNVMGATKRAVEKLMEYYSMIYPSIKISAVRFGNVLRSNGSVVNFFEEKIKKGEALPITHPDIIRYFMTIEEAAQLILISSFQGKRNEIFVLDMGSPVKILKLAEDLITLNGLIPYVDIEINIIGLRPGEKLFEELLLKNGQIKKTRNKKIFIVKKEEKFNPVKYYETILDFKKSIQTQSPDQIIEWLSMVVPTYTPEKK